MPADRPLSEEAQRLLDARKAAVDELKAIDGQDRAITDHAVVRLANARLYESAITGRVLTGENITSGEFKAAADMVEQARSAVPKPVPELVIRFVPPVDAAPADAAAVDGLVQCRRCHWKPEGSDRVTRCYRCGWKHGGEMRGPWVNATSQSPTTIDGTLNAVSDSPPEKECTENDTNAKAQPSRKALPPPDRKHPGSIHNQPGVPLKRYDEPWRTYGRTC